MLRTIHLPDDLGPVAKDGHGDDGPGLAGRQRQLAKLRLLDPYLVVPVDPPTAEVFAPVGVLVVDHQEGEAAVLAAEALAACRPRHRCSQDRGALFVVFVFRSCEGGQRRRRGDESHYLFSWRWPVLFELVRRWWTMKGAWGGGSRAWAGFGFSLSAAACVCRLNCNRCIYSAVNLPFTLIFYIKARVYARLYVSLFIFFRFSSFFWPFVANGFTPTELHD
jgi:hypothetical protein